MPRIFALLQDLKIGLIFYTRLPLRHAGTIEGADLARVTWANPLVGAVVGAIAALIYWIADGLGLPPLVAALLTVTASLLTTGCFHEDGLADTADGFGGGWTRERKLEIMRDSRHGSYGVAALVLALGLRVAALAALAAPEAVALALIASNAGARALIPLMMRALPNARTEGLSAYAGRPSAPAASTALSITIVGMLLLLGGAATFAALLVMLLTGLFMGWLAARQIGGYTGDVLGASEQVAEIAILLAIFVSWSD